MYVCMYVCMNALPVCMYICMYVCMYVCVYARMYARMCVCMFDNVYMLMLLPKLERTKVVTASKLYYIQKRRGLSKLYSTSKKE